MAKSHSIPRPSVTASKPITAPSKPVACLNCLGGGIDPSEGARCEHCEGSGNAPTPQRPSLDLLLLQAQLLLNDADEANSCGDHGTFALQRQAREVLAEVIDRLAGAA